jgi:hypothetical protein
MTKTLLALFAFLALSFSTSAQSCTPDPFYMDSLFGAWPDTITNFPAGQEGVFYSEVLDFKLPIDAGEVDATLAGVPIDSAVLTNVVGLPPGLTYACDVSSCTWYGGQQGCASLYGTPTTPGIYDVTIELDGWVTAFFIPISEPVTFTGYVIEITPAADILIYKRDDFSISQNSPNPFAEETNINFKTGQAGSVSLRVMDILGNAVHMQEIQANTGDNTFTFKNTGLANGIYMYTLSNGIKSVTKKMTVRR